MRQLAVVEFEDVDWEATKEDPTKFDKTTQVLSGYVMKSGKTFERVALSDREQSRYEIVKGDDQVYVGSVFANVRGKSAANRLALQGIAACCYPVKHVWGASGEQRVFGVEYDPVLDEFRRPLRESRMNWTDTGGQFGPSSRPREEFTFVDGTEFSPIYATVSADDFPLA